VHRLHVFDREWLDELVADYTALAPRTGTLKLAFRQEMVGHVDVRIFVRSVRVFLRL
jgi:hypothetical protein